MGSTADTAGRSARWKYREKVDSLNRIKHEVAAGIRTEAFRKARLGGVGYDLARNSASETTRSWEGRATEIALQSDRSGNEADSARAINEEVR